MSGFVTDGVFGPLASRVRRIDVGKTFKQAMDVAADEGRETARIELHAEGAPLALRDAVHVLREPTGSLSRGIGVDSKNSSVADLAMDWEFGSADHSTPPHGTFRMISEEMSDDASEEAARRFAARVVGE